MASRSETRTSPVGAGAEVVWESGVGPGSSGDAVIRYPQVSPAVDPYNRHHRLGDDASEAEDQVTIIAGTDPAPPDPDPPPSGLQVIDDGVSVGHAGEIALVVAEPRGASLCFPGHLHLGVVAEN
jgi:hypothetical protein